MTWPKHRIFRASWWSVNLLVAASVFSLLYLCVWEYSVREYLRGFSDAIVPVAAPPERKIEAILNWMRTGPLRSTAVRPDDLSLRDPQMTLNFQQLLNVCGTATNAFLNLARSSGLTVRRLLLLGPHRRAKHVVAEVLLNKRWGVVDPTYRTILRYAHGRLLTRAELRDPAVFAEAPRSIPGYHPEYSYDHIAHVRLARLPLEGLHLRALLDSIYRRWEDSADWTLVLERELFAALLFSFCPVAVFLAMRFFPAWFADHRLGVLRFQLREQLQRAGSSFFSSPEIK